MLFDPQTSYRPPLLVVASGVLLLLLLLSGLHPFERTTWLLEVFPVLIVLPLLWGCLLIRS